VNESNDDWDDNAAKTNNDKEIVLKIDGIRPVVWDRHRDGIVELSAATSARTGKTLTALLETGSAIRELSNETS
jgi:hypothetical protein